MVCKNCGKEIGDRLECNFCGYNPQYEGESGKEKLNQIAHPVLQQTNISFKDLTNKFARAGFVLGFFAWFPVCWILSFIFSTIGFFKAKEYRSGRPLAIIGWIFCLIAFLILVAIIKPFQE